MIRNEERLLDDLPEERGTMSAREALLRAVWRSWYGDIFEFGEGTETRMHDIERMAGILDRELRNNGFGIYQLHPEPKVT